MLISSNAITAHSIGLVMLCYVKVRVNIDVKGCLVTAWTPAYIFPPHQSHCLFFVFLAYSLQPASALQQGVRCFTWDQATC